MPMLFSKLSQLWRGLLFYMRRNRFDRELEEEMRFHMELEVNKVYHYPIPSSLIPLPPRRAFAKQD
jgi:hypothetical protein